METPKNARIGEQGLLELQRQLALIPAQQVGLVGEILQPLLEDDTSSDASWLLSVRSALGAIVPNVAERLSGWLARYLSALRWHQLRDCVRAGWHDAPCPLSDDDVLHRLRQLALQATRNQSPSVAVRVAEDAPSEILCAFPKFDQTQPFKPWARTVLRNHGVSLWRDDEPSLAVDELDSLAGSFDHLALDELADVLRDFRRLCDTIRFPLPRAGGPDLAAVFALAVRLRLLEKCDFWGPEFIGTHLPLSKGDGSLRVRKTWPTVAELWERLRREGIGTDSIRQVCTELAPEADVTSMPRIWNTWVHRCKQEAEVVFETHAQALLFEFLFRTNRSQAQEQSPQDR